MTETTIGLFTIFVLSVFVGFEVISKVSSTLHTPLMSGANAIHGLHRLGLIVAGLGVGTAIGVPAARAVKMTAIPQMVAAFNGVGGAAAALVSLVEFDRVATDSGLGTAAAVLFSVLVGGLSF